MDSIPSPHSFIFSDEYICQWDSCLKNFDDAERLYEHLIEDHVGRKANHNLCLTCRWDKCAVPTFIKRDHITSHLRVHVPSKPYLCEICKKGFKRPQDLKKHEKIHQENPDALSTDATSTDTPATSNSSSGRLQPGIFPAFPLTPPTALDRSPSVASATTGSSLSPYSFPLSPADTAESWNPGLSSPSYSTNSDLFSSPSAPDLELDMMNSFDRPTIDVSGAYFGAFPGANGYDDMVSPMSAKRSRDGFDEVLSETLGAFAVEAKKKRTDASYNEDMMGRLNALSAILEVNPMTPDRLLSSLPEVSDWDQFNQFNQFCSTLFEDVSGEAFEPQSYDTPLFPEYEQKQTPIALDAKYGSIDGFQNYNAATGLDSGSLASYGMGVDSIYSTVIPDDPFVPPTTSTTLPYGSSDMQWDPSFTQQRPSVMSSHIAKSTVHQSSRYTNPQYVSLPALQQGPSQVKVEPDEPVLEHKVVVKVEREFADMSTQTKGNQNGMMMKQRPSASVKAHKLHEPIDAEALLELAPDVPNTPLPETDVDEAGAADNTTNPGQEQQQEASNSEESQSGEADAVTTVSTSAAPQTKAGSYMQKLRARQAAVAAAAAATAAETSEPIDPVEAMSRQLAQTRLDGPDVKYTLKPSTTKPITAGDMERQIKAAKARALCSEDPVRKQHAEVILNLLKNIDTLMTEHREKVAHYKAAQINGAAYPRTGSGVHVQNHGQIRTVSSYLPRRGAPSSTTHRPSPLRQDHGVDFKAVPDYSQLRSNLTEGSSYSSPAVLATSTSHSNGGVYNTHDEVSTDSPVLYPTSDLHHSSIIPFELSEEERRFIEEDNAKIAAAQAASAASDYHLV